MQRKQFLLSGLIIIFVIFGLFAPQAAEARDIIINATPTLEFDPGTATATTCGTVDVNVRVNEVVNLTAYHLEVTYDRTKVQVVEVVNGGFLAAPGMAELYEPTNTVDDGTGTGRLLFGMAQQGTDGNPVPKSGSGDLITIRLKSLVTTGLTTTLDIDGTKSMLVDWPEAQEIGYTVTGNTTVTVQSCAPTDIALSNAAVDENKPVGTVVGNLSATDPDAGDTVFAYSLVNPAGYPDNAGFQIAGNELQTNAIFDFETKSSYQINVRVTGPHGLTYDEVFTVTVNDVNDAPVLAAIGAKSVVNTGTLAFTATATDQDVPAQTLTFSVKDAPAGVTINSTTGVFSWAPTVATDAGFYYATVCVSDGLLEDCEIVTITVTDGEAPTVVSGVAHGVAPYGDVAMIGTSFAVPQGFVVSTIQFTISEPVTIVGLNVVYMGTVPYGTMAVSGSVVTVTPYPNNEIAAQLGTFTFNVDAGSIEDLAGNALANLSATLTVTDQTNPVMEAVLPAEGLITLGLDDTFILTVDAFDLNLFSLEVDHSFEGTLPEFTVYASATNPWGSTAAKDAFDAAGMTVAYDETAQKWTINFGEAITDTHFIPNGVIFYMVLHDEADNKWGSMSPTTDENTYAYTFEVTNTLEAEIASAPSYVYDPAYTYAGDTVFTDSSNLYTMTYSPAEFLAGGAMNDLARYLGALNYQSTSTIIKITYKGVVYTWDPAEPNTGSNWYNGTTSLVSAMVADYLAAPGDLMITVGDGWHTSTVTFRLLITNTLDDEIESAPSYVYDPVYTYVGTRVFDDATNIYTVTYDDVDFNPNSMYDMARYLGALHRQNGATVTSIVFGGVTYTWDPAVGLLGSNWVDGSGNTLVSAVVAGIGSYDPAVGLVFTVGDGVHTETVTFKFVVTDTTAPTIVSGVAVGATGFAPVTADAALTFTVPQGYTVDHIEITMSEAVQIIAPGIVYFEGNPYGTMSASGSVVTITPYAGNEVAGIPGTFDFTIEAGSIQDLAGNNLATLTATMVVEPSPIFGMTDFGLWGEAWPGAFNVGWQYVPLFDTLTIANIEVGMLDADRKSIVTYTAAGDQLVYQREHDYIIGDKLSSAPFYRVYNGNPIAEGADLDWTVIFGESFEGWSPRWGYVKVTDIYGTVITHELEYTGPSADLTAPTVGEATAIGAGAFDDVTTDASLTFTVPQGYTVEKIDFTMSEAVTVVAGTEVTLAGVPYGLVTVSSDGLTLTVTPYTGNTVANLIGTFSFNVPDGRIFDLSGNPLGTLSATLIVTNVAPVAVNDAYTTDEDVELTVPVRGVLANDTDYDPSILTTILEVGPANGTLLLNANGSFTYTPTANFNGTDSFTYKANDELADSNVATVTITVTAVNDAPLLAPIGPQTVANTASLIITPIASDVDGDALTWSLGAGAPVGAIIDPTTGAFSWAPGTTIIPGNYSATICVSDGTLQDCETVTINVTDGVAPVLTSVTPPEGNVYLAAGEHFVLTVDALDDNLRELEIDHSMQGGGLPEFSVYASESDPYGGDEADFALLGVTVVYNATAQTWTIDFGAAITTTFIGNPDGITFYLVLKDETGNTWGSMYSTNPENTFEYNLILDDVAPVMEAVTPAEGDVYLAGGENFVLTIDALDTNLYSLEIDHSMEGSLPEFTVYADTANPYGSVEAKTAFETQGVLVTYDSVAQVWTIDFGPAVTNLFIANPNGITFYMVLKDMAGNQWGTMYGTTPDNTYEYNLIRDDVAPVMEAVTPAEGDVYLAGGENFILTIDALDTNLYSLEIDHSMEGSLPEFTLYASASDPYGGDEADFVAAGVTVTYDDVDQIWTIDFGSTITNAFIANGGISFYMVLEDLAGNTWGTMYGTTPDNTYEYNLIRDDVAPVMEAVTPAEGDVYLAGGENFVLTIDALDTNLYSLEIDHSMEGSLPEFTVYADTANPYGSVEAKATFEAQGVLVTYDSVAQVWTIDFGPAVTNLFIANPNGITFYMVLKDMAGNTWGTMYGTTPDNTYVYNLIRDDVAPVLVSVTPPHDSTVLLGIGDTFKLTIVADDDNLRELELDHSMEGTLPEFSVYASESDPYGGDAANFATAGVTVTYDAATQTWVIDFGASVSGLIANNGGITFYMVLEDMAGNTWGSMSPTTTANTFKYTVSQDLVAPTIGSGVAKSTADGNVNLVDGKFTVDQGYVVGTIEITMTEPVQVALGTIVTMEGYGPYGTVTANVGGVITITPYPVNTIAALIGSFTFTVPAGSVTDLSGNPFTGNIGLVVLNVAPVAVDDVYSVAEDGVLSVPARGVLINDTDFDPSILTAVKVTDPANGTLTLNADGSFTYTPASNFNGTDTFTYKANDGLIDSNVATVTITVTSINDTPVLGTIEDASIPELVEFSFTATATDADLPAQPLTFSLVGAPEGAAITSAGVFTWTPSELQGPGVYTFTVKVCDDATPALCDEQEVTLTVTEVNVAPVASDLTVTTPEDTPLDITLVATDVDGNTLTYVIVAQPTHGTVTLVGNVATYTPALDYHGPDSFTFKANDGTIDSNVATVTITVTPLNDTPIAVDDFYTMNEDTTLTIAVPGVMVNDSDVDLDVMEVVLVTDVQNGNLSLFGNGSFVYVPDPDFFGTDTFVYRLVTYPGPQSSWIDEAIVTITVNPINDAPVLGTIANATIPELVAFTFTATATDVDLPAQVLTFSLVGAPEGAAITAAGVFTWTPTEAQGAGVYTFTVKVCDDATPALCDEQAVTLTVTEVNTAPVAQPQTVTTPEENAVNVTLVATDAQNDPLTYAIVAQPAHGTVTLVGTTATYTPDLDYFGPDSFTFKANDGLVDSNVATVTITVTNVNDAPVAVDDEYTVAEKATLTVTVPGVLDNDSDVDGDTLSAILVDNVSSGTLTLNADGSFTYTPNEFFNGTDSFTYKAKDAVLESEMAVVTITVTPVNDWPIANDDFYEVLTGNDLVKDAAEGVLANDVLLDPDEQVSIQILDGPQHGTLSMNDDGSFTYTPDPGYMGTDTFRYMVLSVRAINAEWSDDAMVTIVVKPYMGLFLPIIWR